MALLRLGDSGPAVLQLQQALNRAGGSARPKLAEDGRFGPATQARLIEFQRAKGLMADGIAGPAALAALGLSGDEPGPGKGPLASEIFRNNARLQRCLVDDAAHVTRGTQGDFVTLIQYAVLTLQGGTIPGAEMSGRLYGPATARLVHAYKVRKRIINTAYQTTPDEVVGKMTIRSLDNDMLEAEREEHRRLTRLAGRSG